MSAPSGLAISGTGKAAATRLERRALDMPAFADLPAALRRRLRALDGRLPSLPGVSPSDIADAPSEIFEPLFHYLSQAAETHRAFAIEADRSQREREALAWFRSRGGDRTGSAALFAHIVALNARLTDHKGGPRTGPIGLSPDAAGAVVLFPNPRFIPAQLEKLRAMLDPARGPALFRAVIVLALLVNAHPFVDGNGRTARVLFNHVLQQGGMSRTSYVPVYEIAARSRGGYEIALRYAEVFGNWRPLLDYFSQALDLCHRFTSPLNLEKAGAPDDVPTPSFPL